MCIVLQCWTGDVAVLIEDLAFNLLNYLFNYAVAELLLQIKVFHYFKCMPLGREEADKSVFHVNVLLSSAEVHHLEDFACLNLPSVD